MPTFTPPTYFTKFPEGTGGQRMWRFYDGIPTGYVVLIVGGVATTYPGLATVSHSSLVGADTGSGEAGFAAFRGGRSYTVTSGEQTILEAGGYTVT